MEIDPALSFARSVGRSVLTTIRGNGRPQLSNVTHHVDPDGLIRISITADRVKYRNLLREPWAALHVTSDDFWRWVVVEAEAELSGVATDPHDDVVEELIGYYRAAAGEHPDWDDYRRAMVADRRVVARLRPVRAYGDLPET